MNTQLNKKIEFARSIIYKASEDSVKSNSPLELAYSGGKDSDVLLHLTKSCGVDYTAIYKNTTIDPSGTIQHCKDNGVIIKQPTKTFLQLIEQKGFPTVRSRFCCSDLKEYKIYDIALIGVRQAESNKRARNYKEPQICRVYNSKDKVRQYLPLLFWTDTDISDYIEENNIKCHSLYYDDSGKFHVERRLGCLGCPFSNQVQVFKDFPIMLRQWVKAGRKFFVTHPKSRSVAKFGTAEELMIHNLFYDSYEDYKLARTGLFEPEPAKAILERYFNVEL